MCEHVHLGGCHEKNRTGTGSIGLLAGGAVAADKAEKLDGKTLYKTMCKVCHGEDAEAGEYTPMYLIIEQWERFFDEDYAETHAEAAYEDGAKVIDAITPEMLKLIREFCIEGAADSEHPMTCG